MRRKRRCSPPLPDAYVASGTCACRAEKRRRSAGPSANRPADGLFHGSPSPSQGEGSGGKVSPSLAHGKGGWEDEGGNAAAFTFPGKKGYTVGRRERLC